MNKLEQIIREIREDAYQDGSYGSGHPYSVQGDIDKFKELVLSKEWYYYDPDELGEDAFKRLGDDEVSEL